MQLFTCNILKTLADLEDVKQYVGEATLVDNVARLLPDFTHLRCDILILSEHLILFRAVGRREFTLVIVLRMTLDLSLNKFTF